jgi:hypothetical protein
MNLGRPGIGKLGITRRPGTGGGGGTAGQPIGLLLILTKAA